MPAVSLPPPNICATCATAAAPAPCAGPAARRARSLPRRACEERTRPETWPASSWEHASSTCSARLAVRGHDVPTRLAKKYCPANIAVHWDSGAVSVFNKMAVRALPLPITLVCIQMAFTIVSVLSRPASIHIGSMRDALRWGLSVPMLFAAMLVRDVLTLFQQRSFPHSLSTTIAAPNRCPRCSPWNTIRSGRSSSSATWHRCCCSLATQLPAVHLRSAMSLTLARAAPAVVHALHREDVPHSDAEFSRDYRVVADDRLRRHLIS